MKRMLFRLALYLTVIVVVGVGLVLLRNYQMEEGVRAYKEENGVVALAKLKPLAYLGDKTAQLLVGSIYAYGLRGVPKSDADAIYWFGRCGPIGALVAEDGVDPAAPLELSVAKAYASGGEGVKADATESNKWLQLAAKGGSKEAAAMLAKGQQH
jgi:TPR repeat protein